jgi:DNA-directed RNA polymerase specialized sigma24 family protein
MRRTREQSGPGSGYERLLDRLGESPGNPEAEFARFRRSLIKFFDWRGADWPEDCADETLDRLARKMEEGVAVLDLTAFARGIAKLVLHEAARSQGRLDPLDEVEASRAVPPVEANGDEPLAAHLDRCLEALARDAREMVLAYYGSGQGKGKIQGRRRLARSHRLSDNALRSRVQRLRDQLEACVRARTGAEGRERA